MGLLSSREGVMKRPTFREILVGIGIMVLPFVIPGLDYLFGHDDVKEQCAPCDCTQPDTNPKNFNKPIYRRVTNDRVMEGRDAKY